MFQEVDNDTKELIVNWLPTQPRAMLALGCTSKQMRKFFED